MHIARAIISFHIDRLSSYLLTLHQLQPHCLYLSSWPHCSVHARDILCVKSVHSFIFVIVSMQFFIDLLLVFSDAFMVSGIISYEIGWV